MAKRPAFDPEAIFYVRSEQDPAALLARRVIVDDGWVYWDDTNRGRSHAIARLGTRGEDVRIATTDGIVYEFTPLTLELYEAHVQAHVELSPAFESTDALRAFYRDAEM